MSQDATGRLRFRIGTSSFELPLDSVEEIAAVERICPVPLAPAAVRGVVTWRGRVVTLLDLATLLGDVTPSETGCDRLAMILMKPYEHLGLYLQGPLELAHEPQATAAIGAGLFDRGSVVVDTGSGVAGASADPLTLLSVPELVEGCERAVMQQFRRRAVP